MAKVLSFSDKKKYTIFVPEASSLVRRMFDAIVFTSGVFPISEEAVAIMCAEIDAAATRAMDRTITPPNVMQWLVYSFYHKVEPKKHLRLVRPLNIDEMFEGMARDDGPPVANVSVIVEGDHVDLDLDFVLMGTIYDGSTVRFMPTVHISMSLPRHGCYLADRTAFANDVEVVEAGHLADLVGTYRPNTRPGVYLTFKAAQKAADMIYEKMESVDVDLEDDEKRLGWPTNVSYSIRYDKGLGKHVMFVDYIDPIVRSDGLNDVWDIKRLIKRTGKFLLEENEFVNHDGRSPVYLTEGLKK